VKTKTVVELSHKELVDAVIAVAKSQVKAGPGPVTVAFTNPTAGEVQASVTFEWTAKPNGS
jgi:hypothetical protein